MTTVVKDLFSETSRRTFIEILDDQIPIVPKHEDPEFGRIYAYKPNFLVQIHQMLAPFASEIFGEELMPSYSFLSMYQDGGRCPLHIDRDQCYRTIDYLIRQDDSEPWPLHVGGYISEEARIEHGNRDKPSSHEEIMERIGLETWDTLLLKPNEAACYSGTHQWHYRSTPSKGRADLAFFHFVPKDFCGPLD